MDTLLLAVTGLSLTVAAGSSTVAWQLWRGERRRRDARVAALAAAAGLDVARQAPPGIDTAPATPDPNLQDDLDAFGPAQPVVAAPIDRMTSTASPPIPGLFVSPVADSGSGGRQHGLMAAAAVAGVLVVGGAALLFVSGRTPGAHAVTRPPLELVSMGHARGDSGFAVSGLVRNPVAGPQTERVQADVRVFDAAGLLIATRSAPIDATLLAGGQESAFAVVVGEASTAARYRVSFSSGGTLLAHVDRRTNLPSAVQADAR